MELTKRKKFTLHSVNRSQRIQTYRFYIVSVPKTTHQMSKEIKGYLISSQNLEAKRTAVNISGFQLQYLISKLAVSMIFSR